MKYLAATAILVAASCDVIAEPRAIETTVIGPWVGIEAPLHPDNLSPHRIRYFGTDLGFTYEHGGRLQILFGDTSATVEGDPIEAESGSRSRA